MALVGDLRFASPKNVCQTGDFAGQIASTKREKGALILVWRFSSVFALCALESRPALCSAKLLDLLAICTREAWGTPCGV